MEISMNEQETRLGYDQEFKLTALFAKFVANNKFNNLSFVKLNSEQNRLPRLLWYACNCEIGTVEIDVHGEIGALYMCFVCIELVFLSLVNWVMDELLKIVLMYNCVRW